MRRRTMIAWLALLLIVGGATAWGVYAQHQSPKQGDSSQHLSEGDSLFDERSYRQAAEAYERYLEAVDGVDATTNRVRKNLSIAYTHLNDFDRALAVSAELADLNKDGRWEALAQRQSMLIRLTMPTFYTERDDVRYWGRWVQQGRRVDVTQFNRAEALKHAERAHAVQTARIEGLSRGDRALALVELGLAAQIKRELADLLEGMDWLNARESRTLILERPGGERVERRVSVPTWPNYDRVLRLYDEADALYRELAELDGSRQTALRGGLALYAEAIYVDRVERSLRELRDQYGEALVEDTLPEPPDATPFLRAVRQQYPESRRAAEAWYWEALRILDRGDFVEGLKVLRDLREAYPSVKWAADAQAWDQSITAPRLQVSVATTLPAEGDRTLNVTTRNVDSVTFTVHAFDIVRLMADPAFRSDPSARLDDIGSLMPDDPAAEARNNYVSRFRGDQLVAWEVGVKDEGDHNVHYTNDVTIPLAADFRGAFLLTVEADGVTHRSLHVISDLAVVVRPGTDELVHWLVENVSGEPVGPAEVYMRQHWSHWANRERHHHVVHTEYVGDDAGLAVLPRHTRPRAGTSHNGTMTLAVGRDGRFALTNTQNPYAYRWDWRPHTRTMIYTDRPVYRPEQVVFFKGIERIFSERGYRTPDQADLRYRVHDPRGQQIDAGTLKRGEFGTFDGSFNLPADATLGMYHVQVQRPGERSWNSQGFRVEEYKVPEYEVTISGGEEQVRLGEEASATIKVEYYSGGPVSDANVSYRVFRETFWSHYWYPRRGSWYYQDWLMPDHHSGHFGRPLVAEGEVRADANGEVTVSFSTAAPEPRQRWMNYRFVIEAEATDESRRTIEGRGSLVVSTRALDAFLNTEQDLYRPNDNVAFDLRVQTPAGRPVSAEGTLHIGTFEEYWTTETDESGTERRVRKRDETWLHEMSVQTEANGLARFSHVVETDGRYTAKFVTEDAWGNEVVGQIDFLVIADDGNLADARFAQLQLVPERRVYAVGETARVALTSTEPDTVALVTIDTGEHRPQTQLVFIPGTARAIDVPVEAASAPNFWVSAYTVRDGRFQQTRTELFVLPEPNFLDVEIDTVQSEYRPGEEATFTLTVRDADGNPVEAELSLGVVDEALYYIAQDRTPDPRQYFFKRRRHFNTNAYTSLGFSSRLHTHSANTYTTFSTHGAPTGAANRGLAFWTLNDFRARRSLSGTATEYGLELVGDERIEADRLTDTDWSTQSWPDVPGLGFGGYGRPGQGAWSSDGAIGLGGNFGGAGDPVRRARGGSGGAPGADDAEAPGAPAESGRALDELAQDMRAEEDVTNDPQIVEDLADPQVRADFRDLAFWDGAVRTEKDGSARVRVPFPDNLTRWNVRAIAVDRGDRFGFATATVQTTKNIQVRLQAPRFFVERDEVVLTAVVRNQFDVAKDVTINIDLPEQLALFSAYPMEVTREVPAKGRTSVDWRVRVVSPGMATVRMSALTDVESDAHELTFPARVYGAPISVVRTGVIRSDSENGEASVRLHIPEELDPSQTNLRVSVQPSIMSTALDAVPYLIQYPYGCMEQTMSRFMPAVAVRRTLTELGMSLEQIARQRQGADLSEMPIAHRGIFRRHPVFDEARLNDVIRVGLRRIEEAQHSTGGWGWWPGARTPDPYMTAYVLHGLWIAREGGVAVNEPAMRRAHAWLSEALKERAFGVHRRAYMAYVLTETLALNPDSRDTLREVTEWIFERRDQLTNYSRALHAMTAHYIGETEKAAVLVRNMMTYIERDDDNQTARFTDYTGHGWWFWYRDRIEETAWSIRALLRISPQHETVPMLMKWLVNNRNGNAWHSTKATAFAVLAINEYAEIAGELRPNYTIGVYVNGERKRSVRVTAENMFALPNADLFFSGKDLPPGTHEIRLVREGHGTCYFTAHLEYFSKEDHIAAQGSEIAVQRRYFRLNEVRRTDADGNVYQGWEREEITEGSVLESGDLIEVEIEVECLNDYEYLCFEDPKPAGCESVERLSGYRSFGRGLWGYIEFRDEQVVTFLSRVEQGTVRYSYRLRAEIPGVFHALPVQAYGMYAPDLRANSDSAILTIIDGDR